MINNYNIFRFLILIANEKHNPHPAVYVCIVVVVGIKLALGGVVRVPRTRLPQLPPSWKYKVILN